MISLANAEVQGVVRPDPASTRRIAFPFRADPVALDGLGIDPTARQLFVLILDNARNRGWKSRLSNATIGRILGRCPMTISRALGRLEAAGLVRRELIAGGRVRTGIAVTWDGVQDPRLTVQTELRRERLTGSARALEGLGAGAGQNQSSPQSEDQTGGIFSPIGEKIAAPADAATAAAYLKACVQAAKAGQPMPEPPVFANCETASPGGFANCERSPALPAGWPIGQRPPTAPPDAFMPSVNRMVAQLGERLKAASVGSRRVGPKRLAAQLAEVRRKHGRRE